jgi:hypothetical protein
VTKEAKIDEEDFIVGTVNIAQGILMRRQWLYFRERRPDLYGALTAPLDELAVAPPTVSQNGVVRAVAGLIAKS